MACDESVPLSMVHAALAGDRRCREELAIRVLGRMQRLARRRFSATWEVEDATQAAAYEVIRCLPSFRGDGAFEAWVDRIGRRRLSDHRRRQRREAHVSSFREPTGGADAELRLEATRLCGSLPPTQATAFVLHHGYEWTVPQIAAELGVSVETIRSRLRLARARLRASASCSESTPSLRWGGYAAHR